MPLLCLVTLEMASPDTPKEIVKRWSFQRDKERPLYPPPESLGLRDRLRVWRGEPSERDWDRLIAFKERDGWQLVSHRREFVEHNDMEVSKDTVNLGAA